MLRSLLAAGAAAWIALLPASGGAGADPILSAGNSVYIKSASITPADAGEAAVIHFLLVNDGPARVHLRALSLPTAERVRLMGRVAADTVRDLGSIGIDEDEVLDLTGPHLRYETSPLTRPLVPGEQIEVTFDFVDWRVTLPVQVQPAAAGF